MTDVFDRAQEREEEMRQDALREQALRSQLEGESATHCAICEDPIPEGRRLALPGVKTCVPCQEELEQAVKGGGY